MANEIREIVRRESIGKVDPAEYPPNSIRRHLVETLYEHWAISKYFTRGFFRAYNSVVDQDTRVGKLYTGNIDRISWADFLYILADCKKNKEVQAVLMGGCARGKTVPFTYYHPTLGIILQYGKRRIKPDSKFCRKFPFSGKEFGAMIYVNGYSSDSDIESKVNDPRLERIAEKISKKLEKEINGEGNE